MSATVKLRETLRQMLAVLDGERQALAGLDLDAILGLAGDKQRLCASLEQAGGAALDEDCRAMIAAARRKNEVNRQIRNLIAANVAARIDVLAGNSRLYSPGGAHSYTVARA